MIKNILYSLFLHLSLFYLVYLNFDFDVKNEVSQDAVISFISIENIKSKPTSEFIGEQNNLKDQKTDYKTSKPTEKKPIDESPAEEKIDKKKLKRKSKNSKEIKNQPTNKEKIISQKTFKPKQKNTEPQINKEKEKPEKEISKEENSTPEINQLEEKISDIVDENIDQKIAEKNIEEIVDNQEKKLDDASFIESVLSNQFDQNQNIENISLSYREKINIKSQLNLCYLKAISENGVKSKKKIIVKIYLDENGVISSDLNELLENERFANAQFIDYQIAIKNIMRAIEICSPMRNLPADKYDIWKEIILEFGEEN